MANLPRFSHHLFIFFVYCFLLLHEDSKESLNVNNFRKFIDVHLNCIIFRRIFPFTWWFSLVMKVVHYHFILQPKDSSNCWNLTKVLRILLFMLLCVLKDTKCHLRLLLDFGYMPNMSRYIQYFLFNDIHMGLSLWWQIIYRVFMRATS